MTYGTAYVSSPFSWIHIIIYPLMHIAVFKSLWDRRTVYLPGGHYSNRIWTLTSTSKISPFAVHRAYDCDAVLENRIWSRPRDQSGSLCLYTPIECGAIRHLISPRVMPSVNACLKMRPFTPEPESIYCSSVCVIPKDSKLVIPRSDRVHIMSSAFQLFLGDSEHLLRRCRKGVWSLRTMGLS